MDDVAIVGGGLIGLASALELADRGLSVEVFDTPRQGQASWAAAGILGPQSEVPAPSPMLELCRASFALYPALVDRLRADVGFRLNGTLHRAFSDEEARALRAQIEWQVEAGLRVEERSGAYFFPDEGQVDNRKLLLALRKACETAGVRISQRAIDTLDELGPRDRQVVVCAGAWSSSLVGVRVFPVKGQMLALDAAPPPCVTFGGGGYLVPREGRTLVGATSEQPGLFDPAPTEEGRRYLLGVATRHGYAGAQVLDHWAGFRPATSDGLPLLGRGRDRAVVATAHFRNGVLLTPITAKIVAALVLDEAPPVDLAPFQPDR